MIFWGGRAENRFWINPISSSRAFIEARNCLQVVLNWFWLFNQKPQKWVSVVSFNSVPFNGPFAFNFLLKIYDEPLLRVMEIFFMVTEGAGGGGESWRSNMKMRIFHGMLIENESRENFRLAFLLASFYEIACESCKFCYNKLEMRKRCGKFSSFSSEFSNMNNRKCFNKIVAREHPNNPESTFNSLTFQMSQEDVELWHTFRSLCTILFIL